MEVGLDTATLSPLHTNSSPRLFTLSTIFPQTQTKTSSQNPYRVNAVAKAIEPLKCEGGRRRGAPLELSAAVYDEIGGSVPEVYR
ncbi:hypothetical protein L1887_10980 [Cichorium endivia]|nr:hypothetical protein L1887_10980 [Cichorium endivia]